MKKWNKLFSVICAVLTLGVLLFGTELPEVKAAMQTTSLTIKDAEPSMVFDLYQLQEKDEDGEFTTTSDFAGYNLDWNLDSAEKMSDMANTITPYILKDKLTPYKTATADESGVVRFTDLPQGLYLALGEETDTTSVAPVLAYLPYTDAEGSFVYDVEADAKPFTKPQYSTISVCKIWEGDSKESRPVSIEVNLLMDDEIIDTVVLNADNNWQYKWSELDEGHTYRVTETVPSGYTVKVTEDKGSFTITNTKPTTPPNTPPTTPKDKLPQTGQLWWPVAVLVEAGLLLLIVGVLLTRRAKYKAKK